MTESSENNSKKGFSETGSCNSEKNKRSEIKDLQDKKEEIMC